MTWLGDMSTLGMTLMNLPNRSLTWATVEKANLGLDFSMANSRINGSIDVYTGQTTNMLVARSAPYLSGFNDVDDNVGKITNKGVEFVLNTVNINGDGVNSFRWESNLVFDANRNKLVSLFGPDYNGNEADDFANAVTYGREANYALLVGKPLGAAFDLKKLGIFKDQAEIDAHKVQPDAKPGDLKFEDYNGDGKISPDDYQYLGSPDPLFTVNFANTLAWKNYSLYFNFRCAQGDKTHFIWLDPYAFGTSMGGGAQMARIKPWTEDNPSDTYPRYGYNNPHGYQYWNSRSFLKLKDLVFSYTVPTQVIKRSGISNLRCYVAAVQRDYFTPSGKKWSEVKKEVKARVDAGLYEVTASDVNSDYILDERVRELFGEEQRWITLSRLSCNPAATYVTECYPTQDATTSNTLYERTRKYGVGFENDVTAGRREAYTDALGNTRHRPNIQPFNYVLPIPIQIINSNKDREIKQNYGYK